ncbi:hypothetical protein Aph02nite_90670 [Actinoplanes philippinensis]|uniref:Uncharacterized protein n=1 Tax=Actinoplanes philippinensis TaxID=35752 RepID=A0A1I2M8D7_9ACTN|nr:hypothetical protein [Actinoplanes philippinensis]GIE83117.1 hypothetical protein Aph02nite_90670 [Actinoplanes philippinensis]SFF87754.1 hypothetical protein SAMN05421541_12758 [Actinoplanes philippinensis]
MRTSVRAGRAAAFVGAVAGLIGLGLTGPAMATSDSASWNLAGGDKWQVNAWHCGTYVNACNWTSSTKLLGSNPATAQTITNRAELQAHGVSASLTISKNPEATLTMKSKSLGEVKWTNTRAWIADNSGQMKPNYSTVYVSTRSCGSGKVNASITVSEKCVEAGAF